MEIFKKLLLPISSEFFNESVVKRAKKIIDIFSSELVVAYIVEEKTLKKMDEITMPFFAERQRKEIEEEIINENKEVAEILFEKIKNITGNFEKIIVVGEYSDEINKIVKEKKITCVITAFEKECFLKYRLFEMLHIPLLVEFGEGGKNILGVCSNLAPNVRVPKFTLEIAEKFRYKPHFVYIIDKDELVEVDEEGNKIERDLEYLKNRAKEFASRYEKFAPIEITVGAIENEMIKYADRINADLVIIGREMKRKSLFGKELKRELVERIKHSLLFLN